jgi:protein-disulfide isomerase-like protein with CxxC motif
LAAAEAAAWRQEAERLAKRYNIPLAELLSTAQRIAVDRARFRRHHGRDMTRADRAAALAAEDGLDADEVLAEIERIEAQMRAERTAK